MGFSSTSKAASAVNLLDLGLMDSSGASTETHMRVGVHMHAHTNTYTKIHKILCHNSVR